MKSFYLLIALFATTNVLAQDLSYEYQYSMKESEHYVINYPKDSTYLRWGIWLNADHDEFGIHTMKMFMTEGQALFLDEFIGVAQIELEKILAIQFNDREAEQLKNTGIKKIVFFTTYGKFNARFANKKMMQSALETLMYNTEIFDMVQKRMLFNAKIY